MDLKQQAFYDDPSFDYRRYWLGREYEQKVEEDILEEALPKKRKRILDIGAGYGRFVKIFLDHFDKIDLLDPSGRLLEIAGNNWGRERISYKVGVVQKLPFGGDSFDAAVCIRVLHHLTEAEVRSAFIEVQRVLKVGGIFILEYANKYHLRARVRAFFRHNKGFFDEATVDRRTFKNIIGDSIAFNNYHPNKIKKLIKKSGLKLIDEISCSYFRPKVFKMFLPCKLLAYFDHITQIYFSKWNLGPSNFIIAKKT